jgi:SAM-dependent methyltransferase
MTFKEHEINWDSRAVSRLWDYYSKTPPYSEAYFSKLFGKRLLKYSSLPLNEQIDVLDFGSGPGFIWDHMVGLGVMWNYFALDSSRASVSSLVHKADGHPRFKIAKHVTQLPTDWPDEKFDAVLLLEVVEHLGDDLLHATLSEVSRLLKQGGVVVVSCPNNEDLSKATKFCPECGAVFHEWQHVRNWNEITLSACMSKYGLKMRSIKTLDFSIIGVFRIVKSWIKAVMGRPNRPHMISVFVKQ